MMIARANAQANATSRGAADGSTLGGLYGQAFNEAGGAITGITQNQELGTEIFAANAQGAKGQSQAAMGGALTSVGGMVLNNKQEIMSVGEYASSALLPNLGPGSGAFG